MKKEEGISGKKRLRKSDALYAWSALVTFIVIMVTFVMGFAYPRIDSTVAQKITEVLIGLDGVLFGFSGVIFGLFLRRPERLSDRTITRGIFFVIVRARKKHQSLIPF